MERSGYSSGLCKCLRKRDDPRCGVREEHQWIGEFVSVEILTG